MAELPPPAPVVPEPPPPTLRGPLFDGTLPLDLGPPVRGLANASAQGCRACHPVAHDGWSGGPHGGPLSGRMVEAVAEASTTACTTCHLPLVEQHDEQPQWTRTSEPGPFNPEWSATLRGEGVTCVACHVREGRIAVATEAAARRVAPHPMAHAPDLGDERACAACHQLTWPGADRPLYDTVGEWSRSAWRAAGVDCIDCHFASAQEHSGPPARARAWSMLVRPTRRRIVRGSAPWSTTILLQNTGAGHSMPTGTPFRGYRLTATITEPGRTESVAGIGELIADLGRTLEPDPPYATQSDTRLPAGGERSYTYAVAWPVDRKAGRYDLVVQLWRTHRSAVTEPAVITQRVPLLVQ